MALEGFEANGGRHVERLRKCTIKDPLGPGLQRGRATVLRQAKKLNVNQITTKRKNFVQGLVFLLCTACSVYCGIKCITFSFTGSTAEQIASAILLCTLPVWINAQFFLMRTYVNEALKKQGRFFPGVHHHHLHLKNLPCNWCDLCHKRIQDRQGWRCHMCDFDVCNHCAMRANKSGAEGLIRGDKGIKEQKEVTSYKYFCRALSFTSKHIGLVAITVACLLINCGTNRSCSTLYRANLGFRRKAGCIRFYERHQILLNLCYLHRLFRRNPQLNSHDYWAKNSCRYK